MTHLLQRNHEIVMKKMEDMERKMATQDNFYDLQKEDGRIKVEMATVESRLSAKITELTTNVASSLVNPERCGK